MIGARSFAAEEYERGRPGWPADGEMRRDTVPWREALEAEPRLGPLRDDEFPHDLQTDRDGILAMVATWSAVGSLPEDRRAATLAAVRDVLERHRAGEATIRFKTLITSAERVDG